MIPVFDGHNDLLLRLHGNPGKREAIWSGAQGDGHLDLPRMRAGGFAGGFFAIFVPPAGPTNFAGFDALLSNPPYDLPLPDLMTHTEAQPGALAMAAHLMALERTGDMAICRTLPEIETAMTTGRIAAILHMEGAEAIDPDLDAIHVFYAMGLRSLGPVWSRPTVFGHGVPFRYPGAPDTGPGLTEAGKRLIRACNELGIMIDLSHLNGQGFDDVAALSDAPLVATHSNAHAITPSTRNLTDRQLRMIRDSDGMVGLNFAAVFLREDGKQDAATGWDPVVRHLDHLIEALGEDRVGFGSDFDGATVPEVIGDVAGLPAMLEALGRHGYDTALLDKLAHANWLSLLRRTWKA